MVRSDMFETGPIIAAVRTLDDLSHAINSSVETVFLLHADIFNLAHSVEKIHAASKKVFVHLDFLDGLGKDNMTIDFISREIKPDGIISTRTNAVKYAKEKSIIAIQRFFMVDSLSYDTTIKAILQNLPDFAEIMPGILPNILRKLSQRTRIPLIAGGLIQQKNDIVLALNAGAVAVSTARKDLWEV